MALVESLILMLFQDIVESVDWKSNVNRVERAEQKLMVLSPDFHLLLEHLPSSKVTISTRKSLMDNHYCCNEKTG
jgi:hypothetical protein